MWKLSSACVAFILVAILAGVVIGIARGGSVRNLANATFTLWPVLGVGLGVQVAADLVPKRYAFAVLVASYVALLVFCVANLRLAGMGLVAVGLMMNFAVIAANQSMPVRADAIVASGAATRAELSRINFGAKRHLERPDDRLQFLGDIIAVPIAAEVLSFGDLVMSVGVADVIAHLLGRRRRRKPKEPQDLEKVG